MMKMICISMMVMLTLLACQTTTSESTPPASAEVPSATPESNGDVVTNSKSTGYDPEMAAEVGADEFGMRQYVFAYLKRGPNRDLSQEESQALQRAHLNNIQRLAQEGKLVLAGPFMDDGETRGIYVFAVESLEEAEKIAFSDPAIEAGSLTMELHPWYGSAALMKINELHAKVAKENI